MGTSWKSLNIPHDNGFYDGMWWLIPNEWWSNKWSGYLNFTFFLLPFCVNATGVISTRIVLLIYRTWYINKTMICYCCLCCLGGIVGDVYTVTKCYYCVHTPVLAMDMAYPKGSKFWVLEFIQGNFNIPGRWGLYLSLLLVPFQHNSHI